MNQTIAKRIEEVRHGDIPEGYVLENHQLRPTDWQYEKIGKYLVPYDEFTNDTEAYPLATSSRQGLMLQSEYYRDQRYEETSGGFHLVPEGYVTYRHMSDDDIFRFNVNRMGTPVLVSPEYPVFTTREGLNQELLVAYLNNMKEFRAYCSAQKKGSTRTRMYFSRLGEFAMPIPSFAEQQKIAEILATCDRVIELKQQLLEEKRRQKQWLMQKLLSGEIKVSQCSGEYKTMKVRDLADSLTGFPFDSDAFSEDGIRLMRCGNIGSGKTTWESKVTVFWPTTDSKLASFALQTGDVVIGMDGASVGKSCAMITDVDLPCYLVQRVTRLRSAYPVLLFQWFRSAKFIDYVKSRKTVTAIPHISEQDILEFEICVPQDAVSIRRIECILSNADKVISAMEKEIAEWQQKKKALMQLLLTGLIRVNA